MSLVDEGKLVLCDLIMCWVLEFCKVVVLDDVVGLLDCIYFV